MNRFTYIISSLVLLVALAGSLEAQPLFTGSRNAQVKTVQVVADSNFLNLPVIDMEGNVSLDISFDVLADEQPWLDYTIVHCNARWEPDDLSEMDFLDYSHLPLHVENVTPSFNTFLQYYHYAVEFPNEEVRPTVSGNYAILFHWQDEPDSIVAVGRGVFDGCASLATIRIPAGTKSRFEVMLPDRKALLVEGLSTAVQADDMRNPWTDGRGVKYSADKRRLLHAPQDLDYYSVADGCQVICDGAFDWCSALKSIFLPATVEAIPKNVFDDCEKLNEIFIPDGTSRQFEILLSAYRDLLMEFEFRTFVTNDDRANAWVDEFGVKYSPNFLRLLEAPADLGTYVIKEGCKIICDEAFRDCTKLTSIEIPSGVMGIGIGAFSGCLSLESITLPFVGDKPHMATDSNQYPFGYIFGTKSYAGGIATEQFYYDDSTIFSTSTTYSIPSSLKSVKITGSSHIPRSAFSYCKGLTSIEIPGSVTSIGESAFYGCTGLTSIEIPDGVTSIGSSAFSGCTGLTCIAVVSGNKVYDSRNNCNAIIETASNTLIAGCLNTIIPSGVTSIGKSAFSGCKGLTRIEIPDSVTSIGRSAFSGCKGLTRIEIPSSVTSIGDWAFNGCTGLTRIEIPSGVTSIGGFAFEGCTGLTSIEIPSGVTSIGKSAFSGCKGLTSIEIPSSVTSIGDSAFDDCTGLKSIEIPSSVTSIGDSAFNGCTGLTSIGIPDSVTSIGGWAFDDCTSLAAIYIPKGSREKFEEFLPEYKDKLVER